MKSVSRSLVTLALSTTLVVGCGKKSSEEHLKLAQDALAKSDHATAAIELKNAVQINPQDAQVRFLLGQTYFELKQFKAAEKELERALEYGHSAGDVVPLLSKVYRSLGENKQLIKLAAKSKGLKPKQLAQVNFYQLQAYVDQGNEAKAKSLIAEMKKNTAGSEFTQLALAYDLVLNNQLDAAILQLTQIMQQYPNQLDGMKLLSQLYLRNEQPDMAVETLKSYTSANPEDHDTKYLYVRLLADLDRHQVAEPILDELIALYPQQPSLLQLKAAARLSQLDHVEAYKFASEAVNLNLEDNTARLIAGISAYFSQDYKAAETHLALLAGFLPAEHPALRMLADSQLRLGMSLAATETTHRFDAISEQDASLLSNVGRALVQEGQLAKAKQLLSKQPEQLSSAQALADKANLKLSLNDVSGIVDLEQALAKSDVQAGEAQTQRMEFTLALAYLSSGQFEKARELADKWKGSQEKELQLNGLALSSKLHLRDGKVEQAKADLNQAAALEPNNPSVQLELIKSSPAADENEVKRKLAQLEQLLAQHPDHLPSVLTHYLMSKSANQPVTMTTHLAEQIRVNAEARHLKVALGKMWLMEEQTDKAIETLEQAKAEQPESFWGVLASAYIKQKQYQNAIDLYQDWFDKKPNDTQAINGMAKVYDSQQRFDLGLELTQRYLNELGGNNLEIRILDLHFQARNGNIENLKAGLEQLPEQVFRLPFVKGLQGQLYFSEKAFDLAQPLLTEAYRSNPSPLNTRMLLTSVFQTEGRDSAVTFLKRHIDALPNDQGSVLRYAQLITGENKTEAKKYYQQVLKLNSKNFIALNNLANLYLMDQEIEQAHEYAEQALALKPNDGQVLDTIGSIELKRGEYQAALSHLEKAVDSFKQDTPEQIALNYIEALYANQQNRLAERKVGQFSLDSAAAQARLSEISAKYAN